ncbi:MAG: sugar phosphate isomerase/epimerase [archaeon]|nr:sugar phosphate isomerase/epimerase [archaeon]
MTLGIPTLLECETVDDHLKLADKFNVNFMQIHMYHPAYNKLNASFFDKLIKSQKKVSIHLSEEVDFASFQDELRRGAVSLVKNLLEAIPNNVVQVINFHLSQGSYITLPNKKVYIYDKYFDLYQKNLIESLSEILPIVKKKNIILCIENIGNWNIDCYRNIVEILLMKFPELALTWDLGHDASSGFKDNILLQKHVKRIKHYHLHDYDDSKTHLQIGTGKMDFSHHLKHIDENELTGIVEVKTIDALTDSIFYLRNIGIDIN